MSRELRLDVSDATVEQLRRVVKLAQSDELKLVKKFLDQIMQHRMAWPFLEPVDGHLYPSYYQGPHAVMDPIDLCTIKMKLEQGSYADAVCGKTAATSTITCIPGQKHLRTG